MNVERLARLLDLIVDDFANEEIVEKLDQLATALHTKLNSPHPDYDEQFKTALDNLFHSLSQSPLNDLTPSQDLVFKEIDASENVGKGLADRVMKILEENTMTMNLAQQQLEQLSEEVSTFKDNVRAILNGLQKMNIEPDYLEEGEAEVSIVFPIDSSETSLDYLKREVDDLNKIFKVLTEVVDGDTESTKLRAIGSSSLLVTVMASLGVALATAKVINQLVVIYKNVMEIKIKQEELDMIKGKNKQLLDKILEESQTDVLNRGIKDLVKELIAMYKGGDKGRKKELEGFLETYLRKLAKKFDDGFGFEVDSEEPEKPEADEDGNMDKKDLKEYEIAVATQKEIQSANEALKSLQRHEGPILMLGAGKEEDEEDQAEE
ncbi:hypothetical protein [Pseudodesulfovibrio sp.]|uniref:hypothetical protein n=1 Tax=unclassified Pseudodesulfovibrio TaxID=2661612 RepID=UPI003AFFF8EF